MLKWYHVVCSISQQRRAEPSEGPSSQRSAQAAGVWARRQRSCEGPPLLSLHQLEDPPGAAGKLSFSCPLLLPSLQEIQKTHCHLHKREEAQDTCRQCHPCGGSLITFSAPHWCFDRNLARVCIWEPLMCVSLTCSSLQRRQSMKGIPQQHKAYGLCHSRQWGRAPHGLQPMLPYRMPLVESRS